VYPRVVGEAVGVEVGEAVGEAVGALVGALVVGDAVGSLVVPGVVGEAVGEKVGALVGDLVCLHIVGASVGIPVVGEGVVGAIVGNAVVGEAVVGDTVVGDSVVGEFVGEAVVGDPVVGGRGGMRALSVIVALLRLIAVFANMRPLKEENSPNPPVVPPKMMPSMCEFAFKVVVVETCHMIFFASAPFCKIILTPIFRAMVPVTRIMKASSSPWPAASPEPLK
jgi:hypothetical protein